MHNTLLSAAFSRITSSTLTGEREVRLPYRLHQNYVHGFLRLLLLPKLSLWSEAESKGKQFCTPSDRVNFFILKERLDLFRERETDRQTETERGRDRHRDRERVFQEGSVEVCSCTICDVVNCAHKLCPGDKTVQSRCAFTTPAPAFVGFLFICFVCCCCYSSAQDLNRVTVVPGYIH